MRLAQKQKVCIIITENTKCNHIFRGLLGTNEYITVMLINNKNIKLCFHVFDLTPQIRIRLVHY